MNEYTPELTIVGIVGFLVPFVASLFNNPKMSSGARRWVAIGVSVLLAVITLIAVGGFTDVEFMTPQQIIVVILGVLGVAQFVYTALKAANPRILGTIELATSSHDSKIEKATDRNDDPELGVAGLESDRTSSMEWSDPGVSKTDPPR